MKGLIEKLQDAYRDQKMFYMVVLLFFCIGIVIGVYTVMYMDVTDRNDLTSYFSSYINGIGEASIDYGKLIFNILEKNLLLIIPIVFISFTFFGSPIILIIDLVKGFSIGYTFTFLLCTFNGKGLGLALAALIPQNIIYVPCLIMLSVIGLNVSTSIFKNKFLRRNVVSKRELFKSSLSYLVGTMAILFIGILIETFLSPSIISFVATKFYL